jgi:glycine betaine catabolism B
MVQYLVDNNIQRDITLLYVVSSPDELAYHDDFLAAKRIGLRYIPIVTKPENATDGVVSAKLSQDLIARAVPDYADRTFYISGPNRMVDGTKEYLRNLGVHHVNIKTDHFSGY